MHQVKLDIMQLLSPMRLIDMLCTRISEDIASQIRIISMQVINQICDDVHENYKVICLAGLVLRLK